MPSAVRKRSVEIDGRATSVSLEDEFFHELYRIAIRRGVLLNTLVSEIAAHSRQSNLSSEIRLTVLREVLRHAY